MPACVGSGLLCSCTRVDEAELLEEELTLDGDDQKPDSSPKEKLQPENSLHGATVPALATPAWLVAARQNAPLVSRRATLPPPPQQFGNQVLRHTSTPGLSCSSLMGSVPRTPWPAATTLLSSRSSVATSDLNQSRSLDLSMSHVVAGGASSLSSSSLRFPAGMAATTQRTAVGSSAYTTVPVRPDCRAPQRSVSPVRRSVARDAASPLRTTYGASASSVTVLTSMSQPSVATASTATSLRLPPRPAAPVMHPSAASVVFGTAPRAQPEPCLSAVTDPGAAFFAARQHEEQEQQPTGASAASSAATLVDPASPSSCMSDFSNITLDPVSTNSTVVQHAVPSGKAPLSRMSTCSSLSQFQDAMAPLARQPLHHEAVGFGKHQAVSGSQALIDDMVLQTKTVSPSATTCGAAGVAGGAGAVGKPRLLLGPSEFF